MTTETIEALEVPTITTANGKQLPAVLFATLGTVRTKTPRSEIVELRHDGIGGGCDSWQGASNLAGEVTICRDDGGWYMWGGRINHTIRFTVAHEELPMLMGATLLHIDGGPCAWLLVDVTC